MTTEDKTNTVKGKEVLFEAVSMDAHQLISHLPEIESRAFDSDFVALQNGKGKFSAGNVAIIERMAASRRKGVKSETYTYRELINAAKLAHGVSSTFNNAKFAINLFSENIETAIQERKALTVKTSLTDYYINTRNKSHSVIERNKWIKDHSTIISHLSLIKSVAVKPSKDRNKGIYEALIAAIEMHWMGEKVTQKAVMKKVSSYVAGLKINETTAYKAIKLIEAYL